jgi:hypothetical protein
MSGARRPGSWSGEEQFPLVLPQDLFTSSADEEDDAASEQRHASLELGTPGTGHVVSLHAALAVSCALPWALVFPLLVGEEGRGGGFGLDVVAGACACYFASYGTASLVLLLAMPRMPGAAFGLVGVGLAAKAVVSLLFGLLPLAANPSAAAALLALCAGSGLVDGVVALVAAERLALPSARELTLVKTGSEINDVFRFLRGVVFSYFPVRVTEIAGAVAGALLGYLSVVALASYVPPAHFSVFRLGADTLPGFALAFLALVALFVFAIAARPTLRSTAGAPRRARRKRAAEPRVKIPLALLQLASGLIPSASGAAVATTLLPLVGLLVAEPAISTVGQIAGWAVVICFFAAGVWSVLLARLVGRDNEVAHTPVLLVSQGLQCIALVVLIVRSDNVEASLAMLLVSGILQCVQLEYTDRTPRTVLFRSGGLTLGAAAVALAVHYLALSQAGLARVSALVTLVLEVLLMLIAVLQMAFVVSRRQELSSYCLKSSRSRAAVGAVVELLLAECRRELAALSAMGSLSPEDRATVARFTPGEEEPSETRLRECVSELRQLRKRLAAK